MSIFCWLLLIIVSVVFFLRINQWNDKKCYLYKNSLGRIKPHHITKILSYILYELLMLRRHVILCRNINFYDIKLHIQGLFHNLLITIYAIWRRTVICRASNVGNVGAIPFLRKCDDCLPWRVILPSPYNYMKATELFDTH